MFGLISKTIQRQFDQVDNSPLILFRMIFGFLLFAETFGAMLTGWLRVALLEPQFTFSLIGLDWLQPLPGYGMYFYFAAMAICGLCVMVGYHYRISLSLFTILWTLVYWMQKSYYNNHYYLLILFCLFMLTVPAHAYKSFDAKRWNSVVSITCPRWCLTIFKIQLWIVFTYAALNKLYPGWVEGQFIHVALLSKKSYWLIGSALQEDWLQKSIMYGGVIFDLLIIYFLLWKKTRVAAFIASLFFHLFNSIVFQIGIFPYLMIGTCVLFFEPETIRRIFFKKKPSLALAKNQQTELKAGRFVLAVVFACYFGLQIYLPLRHHLFKGDVFWTEEGHRLSWRMMLRVKYGSLEMKVVDPATGETFIIDSADYLSRKQMAIVPTHPDMIWQFAQKIEEDFKEKGIEDVEVYATTKISLNGSARKAIIDPEVDLTNVKWQPFKHSTWILTPETDH